jgi:hypothetical protein
LPDMVMRMSGRSISEIKVTGNDHATIRSITCGRAK